MTVHICPICDREVKLPHDCPSEKPMTDTRKPYDPTWPHGFETRDGRTVALVGTIGYDHLVWFDGDDVIQASAAGLDHCRTDCSHSPHDIFCAPAPIQGPLECWVNVRATGVEGAAFPSAVRALRYSRPDSLRAAVHMREVTSGPAAKEPGSLSAAEVEKLATRWSGWWQHDGCSAIWREAADALRRAARGEW